MGKTYDHLAYEKRCQIYTLKKRGDSPAQIAQAIEVHQSTVYRELKRNKGESIRDSSVTICYLS